MSTTRGQARCYPFAPTTASLTHFWWLVKPTYVFDGRFFAHYFWKVEGTVRINVNSHVAHVWLLYTVINMQDGGGIPNFVKLGKFGKLQIFIKVVGSISGHIRSYEWQPS